MVCIKNDEFCITIDAFCIETDEFCIETDEFCSTNDAGATTQSRVLKSRAISGSSLQVQSIQKMTSDALAVPRGQTDINVWLGNQ